MLRPRVSLLLLLAACGPGDSDATGVTTGPDTTASTGQPTSETTAAPTTTAGDPSTSATTVETSASDASSSLPTEPGTGPGTSTGDDTSTGTGTSAAETTSADDTSTGDTDGADVEYAAFFWAGGLDHVMIHRADFTHDRCTTLHLAWPGAPQPGLAITAPDGYAAQNAQVTAGVDGCLAGMPAGDVVAATSGSGAVVWTKGPQEYCPLQLDVDALLEFPANMPWVPAQELLQAAALTVQNCP